VRDDQDERDAAEPDDTAGQTVGACDMVANGERDKKEIGNKIVKTQERKALKEPYDSVPANRQVKIGPHLHFGALLQEKPQREKAQEKLEQVAVGEADRIVARWRTRENLLEKETHTDQNKGHVDQKQSNGYDREPAVLAAHRSPKIFPMVPDQQAVKMHARSILMLEMRGKDCSRKPRHGMAFCSESTNIRLPEGILGVQWRTMNRFFY